MGHVFIVPPYYNIFASLNARYMEKIAPYQSSNKVRILTAGSLFDGHDAAINIMRRIIQRSGAEVIHLGHNRPVHEIVDAAIEEDVRSFFFQPLPGPKLAPPPPLPSST